MCDVYNSGKLFPDLEELTGCPVREHRPVST